MCDRVMWHQLLGWKQRTEIKSKSGLQAMSQGSIYSCLENELKRFAHPKVFCSVSTLFIKKLVSRMNGILFLCYSTE